MSVKFYIWSDWEKYEWGVVSGGEVTEEYDEGFEEWVDEENSVETAPDFTEDEELVNTYDGPHIIAEYIEDEKSKPRELMKIEESIRDSMKRNNVTFDDIYETISTAYDNTVWWKYEEDDPDLSKSPGMWNEANPSDEAKQWIESALEFGTIHDEYVGLPRLAPINIERMFRRRLNRDEGFRVEDIVEDLQDLFPSISEEKALNIARTETSALLDTAKDLAHDAEMAEIEEEADDPDEVEEKQPLFVWTGPSDDSTTEICSEVKRITENKNGVPLDELEDILKSHATKSRSGTPSRVSEWSPHFQCRHTFERID